MEEDAARRAQQGVLRERRERCAAERLQLEHKVDAVHVGWWPRLRGSMGLRWEGCVGCKGWQGWEGYGDGVPVGLKQINGEGVMLITGRRL